MKRKRQKVDMVVRPYAVSWIDAVPIARANHMLMCDIGFDSADALNAALVSEPRDKLREDFYSFPAFDGRVTHHGMARRRLPTPASQQ